MPCPDATAEELVAEALEFDEAGDPEEDREGRVLVLTGQHDYARYLSDGALALDRSVDREEGVGHVAFYRKGIQPEVPKILADYPSLLFVVETVEQLRSTDKEQDLRAAALVESLARKDPELVGKSWRLVLLSAPDAPETFRLDEPIVNAKTLSGRPVAWTVGPRTIPFEALLPHPRTTDELDQMIEAVEARAAGLDDLPDPSGT